MTRPSFTVACQRAGDWWAVSVPDVPGVFSQAKRLDQVREMAREAIALMLDIQPDSFDLDLRLEAPELGVRVKEVKALRDEASRLSQEASDATGHLVRDLVSQGLSVRDVGVLLGLSPQRVSQIAGLHGSRVSTRKRAPKASKLTSVWAARKVARKLRQASSESDVAAG
jgi:predicted RNase H-like HicB family nuclease